MNMKLSMRVHVHVHVAVCQGTRDEPGRPPAANYNKQLIVTEHNPVS